MILTLVFSSQTSNRLQEKTYTVFRIVLASLCQAKASHWKQKKKKCIIEIYLVVCWAGTLVQMNSVHSDIIRPAFLFLFLFSFFCSWHLCTRACVRTVAMKKLRRHFFWVSPNVQRRGNVKKKKRLHSPPFFVQPVKVTRFTCSS